jgi:hypothetical protein
LSHECNSDNEQNCIHVSVAIVIVIEILILIAIVPVSVTAILITIMVLAIGDCLAVGGSLPVVADDGIWVIAGDILVLRDLEMLVIGTPCVIGDCNRITVGGGVLVP